MTFSSGSSCANAVEIAGHYAVSESFGMSLRSPFRKPQRYRSRVTPDHFASGKTSRQELRPSSTGKALDLVAIGRSRVLPGRELVIQRSYLVQPIDDLFSVIAAA